MTEDPTCPFKATCDYNNDDLRRRTLQVTQLEAKVKALEARVAYLESPERDSERTRQGEAAIELCEKITELLAERGYYT